MYHGLLFPAAVRVTYLSAPMADSSESFALSAAAEYDRPQRLSFRLEQSDDRVLVDAHCGSIELGVLNAMLFVELTVGGILLVLYSDFLTGPPSWLFFFIVGFGSFGVYIFIVAILCAFFLREELVIDRHHLRYRRSTLWTHESHDVPLFAIRDVEEIETRASTDEPTYHCIEFRTLDLPVKFGANLPIRERTWLCHILRQQLKEWQDQSPSFTDLLPGLEEFGNWRVKRDRDALLFEERGQCQTTTVGWLLFASVSNGCFSELFLCNARSMFQGLTPWEACFLGTVMCGIIGLNLMFLFKLLRAVLEPMRVTRITITRKGIEPVVKRMGFGWRRQLSVDRPVHLVLVPPSSQRDLEAQRRWQVQAPFVPPEGRWRLRFLHEDDSMLYDITRLTEGAARWMKYLIQQMHPDWLSQEKAACSDPIAHGESDAIDQ